MASHWKFIITLLSSLSYAHSTNAVSSSAYSCDYLRIYPNGPYSKEGRIFDSRSHCDRPLAPVCASLVR